MCGIVGIAGVMPVNQSIYDALTVLQHRGQDAAGIITIDANNCFRLRKANGLVSDVFEARHMQRLQGNMGIGHVRYPTAGSSSASEAQPFYVNSPYGITLAHNGNLTNAHELRKKLFEEKRRHINTTSDSEILLNIFASELDNFRHYPLEADNIFAAVAATNRQIRGAYACVAMIIGHGMVAFRDPNGIRPLVLGKRDVGDGRTEYMVASESVALDTLGFEFLRDVAPGDPFAGQQQRDRPEQQRRAHHAVDAQREGVDPSGVGLGPEHAFADRGVESPDDVGDPQGRMSFQFSFVHLS